MRFVRFQFERVPRELCGPLRAQFTANRTISSHWNNSICHKPVTDYVISARCSRSRLANSFLNNSRLSSWDLFHNLIQRLSNESPPIICNFIRRQLHETGRGRQLDWPRYGLRPSSRRSPRCRPLQRCHGPTSFICRMRDRCTAWLLGFVFCHRLASTPMRFASAQDRRCGFPLDYVRYSSSSRRRMPRWRRPVLR